MTKELEDNVSRILQVLPLMVDALGGTRPRDVDVMDEAAYMVLTLNTPTPFDDIVASLQEDADMLLLVKGATTTVPKTFMATLFSKPERDYMNKVSLVSDVNGMVKSLTLAVYVSIEIMIADIDQNLEVSKSMDVSQVMGRDRLNRLFGGLDIFDSAETA